jgi:hypothetical protein
MAATMLMPMSMAGVRPTPATCKNKYPNTPTIAAVA